MLFLKLKGQSQQGVSMLFTVFLMVMMAFMFALLMNVGQLTYDRLRLQHTLDEATLAAANIQAIGLNEIADLNGAAFEEYENAMAVLSAMPPWFDQASAQAVINYFEDVFGWLEYYRADANERFAALAHDYADAVLEANMPKEYYAGILELDPVPGSASELLTTYEEDIKQISYSYYTSSCQYCYTSVAYPGVFADTAHIDLPDKRQSSRFDGAAARTAPASAIYMPLVAWIKDPEHVTYAAYQLTQRRENYAIGGDSLADFYPDLTIYSSAKPTGGYLAENDRSRPMYSALLKSLQRHTPEPGINELDKTQH